MSEELDRRFRFHERSATVNAGPHAEVRAAVRAAAVVVEGLVPEGRERALALTKLEETLFWSNAGIARATANIPADIPGRGEGKG